MLQFLKDNNNNIQNYETVKNIITIIDYNKYYKPTLERFYNSLMNNYSLADKLKIFNDFY